MIIVCTLKRSYDIIECSYPVTEGVLFDENNAFKVSEMDNELKIELADALVGCYAILLLAISFITVDLLTKVPSRNVLYKKNV